MERPTGVTIPAVLNFIGSPLAVLGACGLLFQLAIFCASVTLAQGQSQKAASASTTRTLESAEADLRATMAERRKAFLEGDTDKVASSMANEYLQTDVNGYVQSKTAWLNEYFRPLAALIKAGKFRWDVYEEKQVQIRLYGDWAVAIGRLELEDTGARSTGHAWIADPNAHHHGALRFTRVYVKRNGKWLLAVVHNSVPLPPPTANK